VTDAAADTLRRSAAHLLVDDVDAPTPDDQQVHHLTRVLRLRDAELVTVTDGRGSWRSCRFTAGRIEPDGDVAEIAPRPGPITIAFAVPKLDRPDWVVQKLTELGVDRIMVLQAERSVVRWDGERAGKHMAKIRRVAVEALQQSRGVWLPAIDGPVPARDFLPAAVAAELGGRTLTSADRTIAIGPEGGWSDEELECATGRVSIGSTVLRVETAAIVAAVRAITLSD